VSVVSEGHDLTAGAGSEVSPARGGVRAHDGVRIKKGVLKTEQKKSQSCHSIQGGGEKNKRQVGQRSRNTLFRSKKARDLSCLNLSMGRRDFPLA